VLSAAFFNMIFNNLNINKMKIEKPKITMLVNSEYTEIEITDSNSNTTLAHVRLTPVQLSTILARQGYVDCECTTGDLTRIGKKHKNKKFEFEITYSKTKEDLALACNEALFAQGMHEWVSDNYYQSQDSFFSKDGKDYARVVIRRWV
jgi:hypothetical protein